MKSLKEKFEKSKGYNQDLNKILNFTELGNKLNNCALFVVLEKFINTEGEKKQGVIKAYCCRDRLCPLCSMLKARKRLRHLLTNFSNLDKKQLLFLTLTTTAHRVDELKDKIIPAFSSGFNRLKRHTCWESVIGNIKKVEVTRGKTSDIMQAHAHLHCLLEVKKSYFNGDNYVTKNEWLEAWRKSYQNNDIMQIDIQKVRPNKIENSFLEILKYELKPDNYKMKKGESIEDLRNWLLIYSEQMKGKRQISCGGTLKGAFSEPKSLIDKPEPNRIGVIVMYWNSELRIYDCRESEQMPLEVAQFIQKYKY